MTLVYVDTSVVLAELLVEPRRPDVAFWSSNRLVSSQLVEYETMVRLHGYGRPIDPAVVLLAPFTLIHMGNDVLARARAPFPVPVRPLDALHLATADWLRVQQPALTFATYDVRLRAAAVALGLMLTPGF